MKKQINKKYNVAYGILQQNLNFNSIKGRFKGSTILINSIPKSGTNLIGNALQYFPYLRRRIGKTIRPLHYSIDKAYGKVSNIKNGQYGFSHLKYDDRLYLRLRLINSNIKMLFMIRDPRDIVVSNFKYVTHIDMKHKSHLYFRNLPDNETRLMRTIIGKTDIVEPINKVLEDYLPWLSAKECLTIRFENLIGPNGGGKAELQLRSVMEIADLLEISLNKKQLNKIIDNIYSRKSPTFSTGQIEKWKEYFTDEHIREFKNSTSDMLIKYGYEKDYNW